MNQLSPVRFALAPTTTQAAQLQRQAQSHELAQLQAQQPAAPGISLAARIESGELLVEAGRDWLAVQPGLETTAPALLLAALEDLLARRARAAVAMARSMPLPPAQQIRGSGLIRVSAEGLYVAGCPEPVLVEEDALPAWALTAASSEGLSRIFADECGWWLEVVHASGC